MNYGSHLSKGTTSVCIILLNWVWKELFRVRLVSSGYCDFNTISVSDKALRRGSVWNRFGNRFLLKLPFIICSDTLNKNLSNTFLGDEDICLKILCLRQQILKEKNKQMKWGFMRSKRWKTSFAAKRKRSTKLDDPL